MTPDAEDCGGLHRGVVAFRGMRIVVRCNTDAPLRWLEDYFGPYVAPGAGEHAAREVHLTVDPQRHAAITDEGRPGERAIDGFALDGGFAQLTLLGDTPHGRLLHDARSDAFLTVGAERTPVQVVAPRDHARVRVLVMRVVRELAMLESLERGDLLVHAAAAVHRGRAILIAGQKRAGKTTTLLSLLSSGQAQYLSNDRVLVDRSGRPPMAYGLPTIVKIRADALEYLPGLPAPREGRHYLTAREYDEGSTLIEPARRADRSMSPAQLCRWLGVDSTAAAPVGLVVFVRVEPLVERFSLRMLDIAETNDLLRHSLFSSGPAGLVSEAFAPKRQGDAGRDEGIHRPLRLHGLAACECRVGPRAFHPPDVWDSILSRADAS